MVFDPVAGCPTTRAVVTTRVLSGPVTNHPVLEEIGEGFRPGGRNAEQILPYPLWEFIIIKDLARDVVEAHPHEREGRHGVLVVGNPHRRRGDVLDHLGKWLITNPW